MSDLMTLGSGTTLHTVYQKNVEEIFQRKVIAFTPPKTSSQWSAGPNTTRVVDLLRIERRFKVDGFIDSADRTKLKNVFKAGGVQSMTYLGETLSVIMEQLSIKEQASDWFDTNTTPAEPDQYEITFTCLEGTNIGSS